MKRLALALVLAAPPAAQLPDLIFERGNPNAFQTLQAALDASQPGQRVLMRSTATAVNAVPHGTIRRSVTLEGQVAGPEIQMDLEGQGLRIESLTSGVPLVIRNVQIEYSGHSSGYTTPCIGRGGLSPLGGTIVLDGVACSGPTLTWPTTLVWLDCDDLEMRDCQILGFGISDQPACCSFFRIADGTDALRFSGRRLYLEGCTLRGGNANILSWVRPDTCFGYLCPEGGVGGAAVLAPNASCVVVRTFLSDGNGGSVRGGAWPRPPTPGRAGASVLGRLLVAYGLRHESGRDDAGGESTPRGPSRPVGYVDAPLSLGAARIGQPMAITVSASALDPVAVVLGSQFVFSEVGGTLFGAVHVLVSPAPPVLYQGVGQTMLTIPPLPELVDQQLVGQVVTLYNAFPFLSNPSVSRIGR